MLYGWGISTNVQELGVSNLKKATWNWKYNFKYCQSAKKNRRITKSILKWVCCIEKEAIWAHIALSNEVGGARGTSNLVENDCFLNWYTQKNWLNYFGSILEV